MQILDASQIHVPLELRDTFECLRRDLLADVQPVNAIQVEYFNSALRASWTIRRCDAAELALAGQLGFDPLLAPDKRLAHLQRARTQAEREFRLALQQLRRLQTDHAVRMLEQNAGLRALPVPIDAKEYIAAARRAGGYQSGQPISFASTAAALDELARRSGQGHSAWHAWQNQGFPRRSSPAPAPQKTPARSSA